MVENPNLAHFPLLFPFGMYDGLTSRLLLAWPTLGAGDRGGGERVAHGIAWHVKASATLVVGPARAVRPHAPARTCEVGVPLIAACQTASEHKSRPERSAAQGLDAAKKLLSWRRGRSCVDAETG